MWCGCWPSNLPPYCADRRPDEIMPGKHNDSWNSSGLWLPESRSTALFHICIPQELGPPFLVLLACDLSGGISPFQELRGRLHFPVSSSAHGYHERKEHHPKEYPENPPKLMHSPKIAVHRLTPKVCGLSFRAWCRCVRKCLHGAGRTLCELLRRHLVSPLSKPE